VKITNIFQKQETIYRMHEECMLFILREIWKFIRMIVEGKVRCLETYCGMRIVANCHQTILGNQGKIRQL